MSTIQNALHGFRQFLASSQVVEKPKMSKSRKASVKGVMYVSKPRGAKDDIVRTAETREEAQKLAKLSALIVSNKSKFLPRSGVSVRSRRHIIFDFEHDKITVEMSLTSEGDSLVLQVPLPLRGMDQIDAYIPAARNDLNAKRRSEHVAILRDAIESLSLLDMKEAAFIDGMKALQNQSEQLQRLARDKIDERQGAYDKITADTAAFQRLLDTLPKGSFVVRRGRGFRVRRDTGIVSIHDGLEKLDRGERVYALTRRHADKLSAALSESSAHARLVAMRLLEKVPEDHPLALPDDVNAELTVFDAAGDLFARLDTLEEMSEEEGIGEVYIVNPNMIDTYSSYRLPYGYNYKTPWDSRLSSHPLVLDKRRKSLPKRPTADLITLDGVLCVSDKAKAALESLNMGRSQFHYIDGTDDYWAVEIKEKKEGPLADVGLYELTKDDQRRPLTESGMGFYPDAKNLSLFTKRARFGEDALHGPDVWFCDDLTLAYRDVGTIVISEAAVKALKKAKCKWYKRLYAVRVVSQ